jgi:hypothetical protein
MIGVRLFSATKARDREVVGELITEWIRSNPQYQPFDKVVLQSSDAEFHCLTIVLLFHYPDPDPDPDPT